jgi:hypothetical protein
VGRIKSENIVHLSFTYIILSGNLVWRKTPFLGCNYYSFERLVPENFDLDEDDEVMLDPSDG